MIKQAIITYAKAKLSIVEKLNISLEEYMNETPFVDDGKIQVLINRLKTEAQNVFEQLSILSKYAKQSTETKAKFEDLSRRHAAINCEIAFLASNRIENIEYCWALVENIDFEFKECLKGLLFYVKGDYQSSKQVFQQYYNNGNFVPNHFRANIIYGEMLMQDNNFENAKILLLKAIAMKPEDLAAHKLLHKMYCITQNNGEAEIEKSIIGVLEGL